MVATSPCTPATTSARRRSRRQQARALEREIQSAGTSISNGAGSTGAQVQSPPQLLHRRLSAIERKLDLVLASVQTVSLPAMKVSQHCDTPPTALPKSANHNQSEFGSPLDDYEIVSDGSGDESELSVEGQLFPSTPSTLSMELLMAEGASPLPSARQAEGDAEIHDRALRQVDSLLSLLDGATQSSLPPLPALRFADAVAPPVGAPVQATSGSVQLQLPLIPGLQADSCCSHTTTTLCQKKTADATGQVAAFPDVALPMDPTLVTQTVSLIGTTVATTAPVSRYLQERDSLMNWFIEALGPAELSPGNAALKD